MKETKEMKNVFCERKNAGITLIALVITIIVLLILAGVALRFALGDDGIFGRAGNAVTEHDIATGKEETDLLMAVYGTNYYEKRYVDKEETVMNQAVVDYIKENIGSGQITSSGNYFVTMEEDNTVNVYKGNNSDETKRVAKGKMLEKGLIAWENSENVVAGNWTYKADENGKETIVTNGKIDLQLGDYIDYNPKEGATVVAYTSPATKNGYVDQDFSTASYTGNWQVLGIENGNLLITSEDLVKTSSGDDYCLIGQAGYENAVSELDMICSLYGQGYGAIEARSIKIGDINQLANVGLDDIHFGEGSIGEYGTEVTFYWDGTDYPYCVGSNGVTTSYSDEHESFYWFDETSKTWESLSFADLSGCGGSGNEIVTLKNNYYSVSEILSNIECAKLLTSLKSDDYWLGSNYFCAMYDETTAYCGYFGVFCAPSSYTQMACYYSWGGSNFDQYNLRHRSSPCCDA